MKSVFVFLPTLLFSVLSYAQHNHEHNHNYEPRCLTQYYYEESVKENPQIAINRHLLDYEVQQFIENGGAQRNAGLVRIIPVVFHVIHEGGSENISKAQILDQIDLLNLDFRRLNTDAGNTPSVWQSIAADPEIEFRLAQLDPNGNCTDGIVRVFSVLTNNARNNVKSLSYWPSNKYLNVWVVKSIENTSGTPGTVLGFAQFPGGNAATDGIVLRHDYTGSIGTAQNTNYDGRTMTHEVGHWLGLRHIWGDANCGNDLVSDTPTAEAAHSGCPSHPFHVNQCGAGSSPSGEMYMNYMDYTNGNCQNMFTVGQKNVMIGVLNSPVSGRNNLWTSSNLIATGTDGTVFPPCAPIADFSPKPKYICVGTTVNFTDFSWNATPTTWDWSFPGGTPSSSTAQNPSVQYNTPGVFDVTLTVSNAQGSDTKTVSGLIRVSNVNGTVNSLPFSEGFESGSFPPADWFVDNESQNTNQWELTALAAHSGFNSVRIVNYSGNTYGIDELVTPTLDFTFLTNPVLTFWKAFALTNSSGTAQLRVLVSTNCGNLWTIRYNRQGSALATAPVQTGNFIPNASQWDQDTLVNLTAYNNKPSVRFKFEYTQNSGNNLYLDDINITGVLGMHEAGYLNNFSIYPNPAEAKAKIEFSVTDASLVFIEIHDLAGRLVQSMDKHRLSPGDYVYEVTDLMPGSYTVTLRFNDFPTTQKLIIR